MFQSITTKLTALPIVSSLLLFFAPIKLILILVGLAILLDTIFGIIKAKKLNQKITSRKLGNILVKMLIYQGAILTFFAIDVLILGDFIALAVSVPYALTKVVALIAVSIELFSIDESIRLFNNGKGFKYYFKQLFNVMKDVKDDINQIT
jgi:hypothetical protein